MQNSPKRPGGSDRLQSHSHSHDHSSVQWFDIDADMQGQRVDNFLLARLKGAPKSLIYRIVRKGEVRVNKGRIKPDYKLKAGDKVRVPPVKLSESKPIAKPSDALVHELEQCIVYEDDGLLIVNKPSGLAVHGGSGVSLGLIESLRHARPEQSFLELVHRLDRDTSGCVMVAKSRRYLRYLQDQLRQRKIDKTYQALVLGRWSKRKQKVDVPLLRAEMPNGERIVKPASEGVPGAKAALTEYSVITVYPEATLVQAKPVTGRTHQIRVHCLFAGHPILGDDKYCEREVNNRFKQYGLRRLFLHAFRLDLNLPDGTSLSVDAPLKPELEAVLQAMPQL